MTAKKLFGTFLLMIAFSNAIAFMAIADNNDLSYLESLVFTIGTISLVACFVSLVVIAIELIRGNL